MSIAGIDYSYTSPSICLLGKNFSESNILFLTPKKKFAIVTSNIVGIHFVHEEKDTQIQRFEKISKFFMDFIRKHQPERICIEGYSMGSRNGKVFDIAENCGILKYHIEFETDIPHFSVAPTSVKKFYAGKGNADKLKMLDTLKDTEGIDLFQMFGVERNASSLNPISDILDSYAIAKYGECGNVKLNYYKS